MRRNTPPGTTREGPVIRALPLRRRRLGSALALAAAVALLATACGGGTASAPVTTGGAQQAHPSARSRSPAGVTAAALEALLPARVAGVRLHKAAASGAALFGGDAFSHSMTSFLRSLHKKPADLRFANARDTSGKAGIEIGVFALPGVAGSTLLTGIVAASRPDAPGLAVAPGVLGGKRVTKLTYPGGSILYLHPSGSRVFYVGTQSEPLAARVLGELP